MQVFHGQTQSVNNIQLSSRQNSSQFTGMIEKDGSYYYSLNGILVLDYNGTVETNMGTFYLVNGKAQIKTVASGKVVYSDWCGTAGLAVIIKHSDKLYSHYYHFSSIKVKLNDTVSQNQVLGIIGTTGDSTGIHLHFGVSKKLSSEYIDPMIMLPPLQK